jgi:hypothetical protein
VGLGADLDELGFGGVLVVGPGTRDDGGDGVDLGEDSRLRREVDDDGIALWVVTPSD